MWVKFTKNFDWKPHRNATIEYVSGSVYNVTRACGEQAKKVHAAVDHHAEKSGQDAPTPREAGDQEVVYVEDTPPTAPTAPQGEPSTIQDGDQVASLEGGVEALPEDVVEDGETLTGRGKRGGVRSQSAPP